MNTGSIIKSSFVLGIVFTCIGAYLTIIHAEGATICLILGVMVSLFFIASAIYEVATSETIDSKT